MCTVYVGNDPPASHGGEASRSGSGGSPSTSGEPAGDNEAGDSAVIAGGRNGGTTKKRGTCMRM